MAGTLERLGADIYRPPHLRREARRFAADDLLRKELADALTILIAELPTWDWPAEGLATRALWTRNKWRLYLDEDLPTACLLEVIGGRWVAILEHLIGDRDVVDERRARLKKLLDLGAPEVILVNERRMLRQAEQMVDLGLAEEADPWEAGGAARRTRRRRDSRRRSRRRARSSSSASITSACCGACTSAATTRGTTARSTTRSCWSTPRSGWRGRPSRTAPCTS